MKTVRIALIAVVAIIAFIAFGTYWGMHSTKMAHLSISDGKDIEGDGDEPYVEEAQHIMVMRGQWGFLMQFFDDQGLSNRFVRVNFANTPWKDADMHDVPPKFPSKNYLFLIQFGAEDDVDMFEADVGRRLEPNILITLFDSSTGDTIADFRRDLAPPYDTTTPYPPLELYNIGHADLVREGENMWTLDVDAWFRVSIGPTIYYVRLNFMVTLEYKSLM